MRQYVFVPQKVHKLYFHLELEEEVYLDKSLYQFHQKLDRFPLLNYEKFLIFNTLKF